MNQKYEFTGETKKRFGGILHRIRALTDFDSVKKGDIGGWIESEKNLSTDGNAWVYDNACVYGNAEVLDNAYVYGNARVYDDARVFGKACVYDNAEVFNSAWVLGNARVYGNAEVFNSAWVIGDARVSNNAWVSGEYDFITIGPIGSRNDITTFYRLKQGGIGVQCGCFSGTIDDFEAAVHETHAGTIYERTYMAAIRMAKEVMIRD